MVFCCCKEHGYFNITDMAMACEKRIAVPLWIRANQTIDFLEVWERRHNPNYSDVLWTKVMKEPIYKKSISIKLWIDLTGAIGIFTEKGKQEGTYVHKDIAMNFAGWLVPRLEPNMIQELQEVGRNKG